MLLAFALFDYATPPPKLHYFEVSAVGTLPSTAVKSPVSPLSKAVYLNDSQIQMDHTQDIRIATFLLQF